ncbi:hypothetical protein [uncultured Mesotoga sp.]|mgnify:CR=1 FL=1|uniref:hypothetical protein n=1 Tax=uncultured Mesotoga sp. TaxID=1184400 RepID=UPI000A4A7A23|nr:hypothetical protein [uncultured Mesotoga sp.]
MSEKREVELRHFFESLLSDREKAILEVLAKEEIKIEEILLLIPNLLMKYIMEYDKENEKSIVITAALMMEVIAKIVDHTSFIYNSEEGLEHLQNEKLMKSRYTGYYHDSNDDLRVTLASLSVGRPETGGIYNTITFTLLDLLKAEVLSIEEILNASDPVNYLCKLTGINDKVFFQAIIDQLDNRDPKLDKEKAIALKAFPTSRERTKKHLNEKIILILDCFDITQTDLKTAVNSLLSDLMNSKEKGTGLVVDSWPEAMNDTKDSDSKTEDYIRIAKSKEFNVMVFVADNIFRNKNKTTHWKLTWQFLCGKLSWFKNSYPDFDLHSKRKLQNSYLAAKKQLEDFSLLS